MKTEGLTFEIRKKYKELRPSEQKAADAVLEGKIKISDCTIKEFADLAGVSQPTVIRFANAMGVKGYKELKRKAIEEESKRKDNAPKEEILEYPVCRTDRLLDIPAKVIMTNIRHLEETLKGISRYEFSRAVHALEKAENISVFAVENSACAAEDFVTKMSYMGKKVYFNKDSYMQNVNAVNLTSKDVAVGISHTGNSKQTVNALACAKEAGAFTISVTNFENAVLNR